MKLTLRERRQEVPGVESFIFEPAEPLAWKAGQYLHYVLHHEPTDERGSDRWFTIASAPFEKRPMITTRFAPENGSSFKQALAGLNLGDEIEISALEGDFTIEDERQSYVFLAGGIGITPFHSILKQADHDQVKLTVQLLYANRDAQVPYKSELESFASRNPNLAITYLTAPERIDKASIKKYIPDLATPIFYVSGPEPMVKSIADTLRRLNVPEAHIKTDDFPGYPEI